MSVLDALLASQAYRDGRAQRKSAFRHRHLVDSPLVLVPWHLGAEPFTFAALAYGSDPDRLDMVVPGEPRDRRLLFPVALTVARWFNARFEEPWSRRSVAIVRGQSREMAPTAPQLWVPNEGAITILGKLGRRLAYLPTEPQEGGPPPADPELVRLGRHLMFLAGQSGGAGQQLVVAATTLAGENWTTEQTVAERANLAALDAWIQPPEGAHGFDAACRVEDVAVGPLPPPATEMEVTRLIAEFRTARSSGDAASEERALREITAIYRELSERSWDLTWRVIERERAWSEEPHFVQRRWAWDVDAYSWHMAWMDGPAQGRRRTRQTMPQAIRSRAQAEAERARVEAEESISDPLRMIPHLLDHRAVEGVLVAYEADHREVKPGNTRASRVPLVTIRTTIPCLIPRGKKLWWTELPDRVPVVLDGVTRDHANGGTLVRLKVMEHVDEAGTLRTVTGVVCFSQFTTRSPWPTRVAQMVPWTHRRPDADDGPQHVEDPTAP
jgi:hypothetical protein